MDTKFKVVITDDRHSDYAEERAVLERIGCSVEVFNCTTVDEVIEAANDADGVLCNLAPMSEQVIKALSKCRVISRYGVGVDNVDVKTATDCGIWIANVPDYCTEDVSDHTMALLFACLRKIVRLDNAVRSGGWNIAAGESIGRIQGKVYGLIGYGPISRAVHRKLSGFQLSKVLVFDPFVSDEDIRASNGCKVEKLDDLCKNADFISIHTPLNDKTMGMIGRKQLALMKSTAILINVARGKVIDEEALIEALKSNQIHMAGLDVYKNEPPKPDCELFKLNNVVLSDHAAYYSQESMTELKTKAAENIATVLSGQRPAYAVNEIKEK